MTPAAERRRLPVQEAVDVAAPLASVYRQWTLFARRRWEVDITERAPGERVAWRSAGRPRQVGVARFAPLAHNLTRVQVDLALQPQGLLEKTVAGTRITRRALRSDLMRFKALMELRGEQERADRRPRDRTRRPRIPPGFRAAPS